MDISDAGSELKPFEAYNLAFDEMISAIRRIREDEKCLLWEARDIFFRNIRVSSEDEYYEIMGGYRIPPPKPEHR